MSISLHKKGYDNMIQR